MKIYHFSLYILLLATGLGACRYEEIQLVFDYFEEFNDTTGVWSMRYVDAIQTSDGRYVALGFLDNGDSYYVLLDKYDRSGARLWSRVFGVGDNLPVKVCELTDGDLAIAGTQFNQGYVIRTDPEGVDRGADAAYSFPATFSGGSSIEDMDVLPDGSLVLLGVGIRNSPSVQYSPLFVRLDDLGNGFSEAVWEEYPIPLKKIVLGSSGIRSTKSGDSVVIATTLFNTFAEPAVGLLLTLQSNGAEAWRDTIRGVNLYDVAVSNDGKTFVAAGESDGKAIAVKINSNRSGRSVQKINGEVAFGICNRKEGGMAITGAQSNLGAQSVSLQWLSASGVSETSTASFSGYDSQEADAGLSVIQTSEGGYLIAGYSTRLGAGTFGAYLIKSDPNGKF